MLQMTKTGQAAYRDWLKSPVSVPRLMRQEFMAKYYFARREGREHARALVELQRSACKDWLETMEAEKTDYGSFDWLVQQYRIGQIEATLSWLEVASKNPGNG
jgi:hypothetical protein